MKQVRVSTNPRQTASSGFVNGWLRTVVMATTEVKMSKVMQDEAVS
jgi:hypothetical protein